MAGLFIKELRIRGRPALPDRLPGNLVEQWQGRTAPPLWPKLRTADARAGGSVAHKQHLSTRPCSSRAWTNWPATKTCRTDCPRASGRHQRRSAQKMSASFFGGEVNYTKRHRLGQLLPHHAPPAPDDGYPAQRQEEDFQLFMGLLDDRFEGRFRDGALLVDVSDMMRRMVKEQLLKPDGTPLFPERLAYTVPYRLSDSRRSTPRSPTTCARVQLLRTWRATPRFGDRRLCPDSPAAPPGVLARGDLPVPCAPRQRRRAACARPSWSHGADKSSKLCAADQRRLFRRRLG